VKIIIHAQGELTSPIDEFWLECLR